MITPRSVAAALLTGATVVAAQQCPAGYAPISGFTTSTTSVSSTSSSTSLSSTSSSTSLNSTSSSTSSSSSDSSTITSATSTSSTLTTSTTSSSTSSSSSPAATGGFNWVPCGTDGQPRLECADFSVLADYTNPAAGNITIPVVRIKSASATPRDQSIFFNPGGPGINAISQFTDASFDSLIELTGPEFDWITFDPRGVSLNDPYQCPDVDDRNVPNRDRPLETDAGLTAAYQIAVAQANKCNEFDYRDPGTLVGTAFVARDINAVFEALGQDGLIRYYGVSYGTLLGETLAAMFPTKIERMVLDGNINPTDYYHGIGAEAVSDYDDAYQKFLELCAAAGPAQCPLAKAGETAEQLQNKFTTIYLGLRSETYTTANANGETVGYKEFMRVLDKVLFEGPYQYKQWVPLLNQYYSAAAPASGARMMHKRQSNKTVSFNPEDANDDAAPQALNAINCGDADRATGVTVDTFEGYLNAYLAVSKYGGDGGLLTNQFVCSVWKLSAKERFPGQFTGITTKRPIYFVQTPYDPVTPLISARNASFGFVGSAIQIHNGLGHTTDRQPSCELRGRIKQYFDSGIIPTITEPTEPDQPAFPYENFDASAKCPGLANLARLHERRQTNKLPAFFLRPRSENQVDRRQVITSTTVAIPAYCTPISTTYSSTSTSSSQSSSQSTSETTTTAVSTQSPILQSTTSSSSSSSTTPAYSTQSPILQSTTTSSTSVYGSISTSAGYTSKSTSKAAASGKGNSWDDWSATTITTTTKAAGWPDKASGSMSGSASQAWGSAKPSSSVYVVQIVEICATGLVIMPVTVTTSSKPAATWGVPGYNSVQVWCDVCAAPDWVWVASASASASKGYGWPAPSAPAGGWGAVVTTAIPWVPAEGGKPTMVTVTGPATWVSSAASCAVATGEAKSSASGYWTTISGSPSMIPCPTETAPAGGAWGYGGVWPASAGAYSTAGGAQWASVISSASSADIWSDWSYPADAATPVKGSGNAADNNWAQGADATATASGKMSTVTGSAYAGGEWNGKATGTGLVWAYTGAASQSVVSVAMVMSSMAVLTFAILL